MIGLKKIITISFVLCLLCVRVYGATASSMRICSDRILTTIKNHNPVTGNYVLEMIDDDDDVSKKNQTVFSAINHSVDISNVLNTRGNNNALLIHKNFGTNRIKRAGSGASFLMNFRI